jgi:hypothetical protein
MSIEDRTVIKAYDNLIVNRRVNGSVRQSNVESNVAEQQPAHVRMTTDESQQGPMNDCEIQQLDGYHDKLRNYLKKSTIFSAEKVVSVSHNRSKSTGGRVNESKNKNDDDNYNAKGKYSCLI